MTLTTIDPMPALVVIDLQKGIVAAHKDDSVTGAVQPSAGLAAAFRGRGLPVVLVNVTGRPPGRTESGWSGTTATFPPGWTDLIDELDVQPTDHLISKRRRSAFHDTGLDTLPRDLGVTQVVLTGVSTSSRVESTARSASDHGYHVVLATDAITDPDAEAHRHSVARDQHPHRAIALHEFEVWSDCRSLRLVERRSGALEGRAATQRSGHTHKSLIGAIDKSRYVSSQSILANLRAVRIADKRAIHNLNHALRTAA